MDDEKAVEAMAAALGVRTSGYPWDRLSDDLRGIYRDDARAALAAIRAAGGEVVWWRPADTNVPDAFLYPGVNVGIDTHFAILRGPEVKP